jgi:surface antigen
VSRALSVAICVAGAMLTAGCVTTGLGPAVAPAAASPTSAALPTGAALGGLLGGPIGASLDEADRQAAYDAQVEALETGGRRAWRGAHGAYGYVEPAAASDAAQVTCRGYTQTIYVAGRPQRGQGLGCRQPDGSWRMAS